MLVHRRVTPRIKSAGTHLYTWVERGTVRGRVSCPRTQHIVPGQGSTDDLDKTQCGSLYTVHVHVYTPLTTK